MLTRRRLVMTATTGLIGLSVAGRTGIARAATGAAEAFEARVRAVEADSRGRLGVAVMDVSRAAQLGYRGDERFPMCSTFKVLAAAAVLQRVDQGKESLARRIAFTNADIVSYSPATEKRVGGEGMTIAELCEAAITLSDNTAANLMLTSLGGPEGLTAFVRALGDQITRLDRNEPSLNEALDGDPRDTTTPAAMTALLQKLVLGDVLSQRSREQLAAWMVANTTGGKRLRAGLPASWRIGDKTGTGDRGTNNDVAVIWTPRGPVIVSVYLTGSSAPIEQQNAAIASIGRVVAEMAAA